MSGQSQQQWLGFRNPGWWKLTSLSVGIEQPAIFLDRKSVGDSLPATQCQPRLDAKRTEGELTWTAGSMETSPVGQPHRG